MMMNAVRVVSEAGDCKQVREAVKSANKFRANEHRTQVSSKHLSPLLLAVIRVFAASPSCNKRPNRPLLGERSKRSGWISIVHVKAFDCLSLEGNGYTEV